MWRKFRIEEEIYSFILKFKIVCVLHQINFVLLPNNLYKFCYNLFKDQPIIEAFSLLMQTDEI